MSNVKQFLLIYSVIFYIIFAVYSSSSANEMMNKENSRQGFLFFPEARISIAPSVVQNNETYLSITRYISADLTLWSDTSLSVLIKCFSIWKKIQSSAEKYLL
jgi:hypothetical protein